MIVRFIHKSNPKTGKGKFASRLAPALCRLGVEITQDQSRPVDIDLQFGKWNYRPRKAKKTVIRLGPAHVDTNQNYRKLNARKWKDVKRADGIIYQSRYSRKVCRHFLGKPKGMETIIFNGADPKEFDVPVMESEYQYNFLASTRKWLPQKRLRTIVRAFADARINDSCLWICGETFGQVKRCKETFDYGAFRSEIRPIGVAGLRRLAQLYRLCNAMVHITYLDACPNSVVEALVAGCPVITNNTGGTHELEYSSDRGMYSLALDKKYDFKPTDLSKPPKVDTSSLSQAMRDLMQKFRIRPEELYIENIAQQYTRFFEELCRK